MTLTTAEERDQEKSKVCLDRDKKLKDRKEPHGNAKLAQTDGLKPLKIKKHKQPFIQNDDNEVIDLRRVRSFKDVSVDYE